MCNFKLLSTMSLHNSLLMSYQTLFREQELRQLNPTHFLLVAVEQDREPTKISLNCMSCSSSFHIVIFPIQCRAVLLFL